MLVGRRRRKERQHSFKIKVTWSAARGAKCSEDDCLKVVVQKKTVMGVQTDSECVQDFVARLVALHDVVEIEGPYFGLRLRVRRRACACAGNPVRTAANVIVRNPLASFIVHRSEER